MSNSTDIIIVGAGIAGLAAGCYAQMNGYRTQIFEMHDKPGGLCTAWQRQGFIFDGCIQYLFGSGRGQPFYRLWEELGIAPQQQFFHHEELLRVSEPHGQTLIVYSNPDRLERHLTELSPRDRVLIRDFCADIRTFSRFDLSLLQQQPKALMNPIDWLKLAVKMVPFVCPSARWGNISAAEFARQFRDPFLRRAIPQMFAWESIPVMVGMSLLAYMNDRNAGFPLGGSLQFAQKIAARYLELGGQIHYNLQVEKILIENDRAIGIRLYNNECYRSDRVISACDGHNTLFNLIDRQYLTRQLYRYYDGRLPMRSQLQVSLGIDRDLSHEPHWKIHLLDPPVTIADADRYEIGIKNYCFDRSLAPVGKSVLIAMLPTNYDYWQRIYGRWRSLSERESIYAAEKLQESQILIDLLDRLYPGIQADIACVDVATPLTYERYTGNWQGATCGWLLTKQTLPLSIRGMPNTLPKLRNFYAIGQWVEPGGSVPIVAMSGRNIVKQICHQDDRLFNSIG